MLVGRLPLHRGSVAGCCMGVAKSMCSVMLGNRDDHISRGDAQGMEKGALTTSSSELPFTTPLPKVELKQVSFLPAFHFSCMHSILVLRSHLKSSKG